VNFKNSYNFVKFEFSIHGYRHVITTPERHRWTGTDDILWHNRALRSIAR